MTGHYSCWTPGSTNFNAVGPRDPLARQGVQYYGSLAYPGCPGKVAVKWVSVCLLSEWDCVANCFQCGRRLEERHMERLDQDLTPTLIPSGRTSCQMEWARGVMMTKLGVSFTRTACLTL